MRKRLRVLIVGDSEDGAHAALRELQRDGYELTCERVEDAQALAAALDKRNWDTVITDCVTDENGKAHHRVGDANDVAERKRAEAEREVMFDIIQGATVTSNLDELLGLINRSIKKALYAENFFVALYDRNTETFSFPYFVDEFDAVPSPRKLKKSTTDYVFRTGKPLLSTGEIFRRMVERGEVELVGTRSQVWLGVPLKTPHEIIGVLAVQHYEDEAAYTERDLQFLTSVGGQIALAIERKRAEEALRESEDRYRDLVEHSYDLICTHDLDGRIHSVNRAAVELMGYDPNDFINKKNIRDILVPEYRQQFDEYVEAIKRDGVVSGVMQVETASGERRFWEFKNTLRIEGVAAPIVRGMAHDITERKRAEAALRQAEEKYRGIFENAVLGFFQSIPGGRFINANPALARMLGYESPEELIEKITDMARQFYANPERRSEFEHLMRERGTVQRFEYEALCKDGSRIWVWESARTVRDSTGAVAYYEGIIEDITARKQAGEALKVSERKYKDIFEFAPIGIYQSCRDGTLITANHALAHMLGYESPDELLKINLARDVYLKAEDRDRLIDKYEPAGYASNIELQWRKKDGSLIWISLNAHAIEGREGRTQYFEGFTRDITERKQVEEERERLYEQVRAGREQLQALSRRLLDVQETERRALARELHDEIGQALTGLKLALEMAGRLSADAARITLNEAKALVNELMAQVRDLSLDLRPAMLDDLGLLPALLWHFERYTAQTSVQVNFVHNLIEGRRFVPEAETAAYRIVQESLTNVVRHARVADATVRVWADHRTLVIEVKDQGVGFDYEERLAAGDTGGLAGMRERAILLGGQLMIESSARSGTRLMAELPIGSKIEDSYQAQG